MDDLAGCVTWTEFIKCFCTQEPRGEAGAVVGCCVLVGDEVKEVSRVEDGVSDKGVIYPDCFGRHLGCILDPGKR